MPSDVREHSDFDEPLDAIVYDVHPALMPPPAGSQPAYPYGPPRSPASLSGENPFQDSLKLLVNLARGMHIQTTRSADYVVPKRFGMAAILGMMTALAVLFGALRLVGAEPMFYLFFGTQALAICLVQMFNGQTPRAASAAAGGIILPLFVVFAGAYYEGEMAAFLCAAIPCVPVGAFMGYLTGTCAAGVFLVMDRFEQYLAGERAFPLPNTAPREAASP
jgi:hypothetical protein